MSTIKVDTITTRTGSGEISLGTTGSQTINRTGNGDLITLQKGGVDSGSISIESSGTAFDGEGSHAGLKMFASAVAPRQNGADVDNTIDLGWTGGRFKDIYLGGGLYVGGTGAANKFEDYEEGTWTPTFPQGGTVGNIYNASYTKVGKLVYVGAYFVVSAITNNSSPFFIGGLPFTVSPSNNYHGVGSVTYSKDFNWDSTGAFQSPTPGTNTNHLYFHRSDGTAANLLNSGLQGLVSKEFIFALIYLTDS